jgi:2,3-bisphosphoglycerate-independent phosphoglycerate mutase
MVNRALLLILDGFGEREPAADNAIHLAGMPNYQAARARGVASRVFTSGAHVGLPDGQMGNSEVGHINIGAGRVIKQTLVRITEAVQNNRLIEQPALQAMAADLPPGNTLHLIGLVSDGGVHSAMSHIKAALDCAAQLGVKRIAFHALTDGRDTAPDSASGFIAELEAALPASAFLASIGGRYYAMDRDQRWDRVEKGWRVMVDGIGPIASGAQAVIDASYEDGKSDEFLVPTRLENAPIMDGDAVWFLNFRADRVRQFAAALTKADEPGCFKRKIPILSSCVGMIQYRGDLGLDVLFEPLIPDRTIGELIAQTGLAQLRIAETEKYAHVTYFFSGGIEAPFAGEERLLIDSPREVATYDQKPQMSAPEVSDKLVAALSSKKHHLIVCNFANPDMVGHTGDLAAAIAAMCALDECLGAVLDAAERNGYGVLISADHGNIEQMRTAEGKPHTQHTTGPVPLLLIGMGAAAVRQGALCDIAPTLLDYMGLEKPAEMTGQSLLVRP